MPTHQITPVLIAGFNRNGTTWLGNILSQCFEVTTARHELHYGFCETDLYENAKYWGNFQDLNNYIFFLESYCNADLFKILEGNKDDFFNNPATDFYSFFFELIDKLSEKQGNQYWTVKLSPRFFHDTKEFEAFQAALNKRYGSVKYIVIRRDFKGYIRSYMNMIGKASINRNTSLKKLLSGITGTMFYRYFYPKINRLTSNKDTLHLSYESLKNDYKNTIDRLNTFLEHPTKPLYNEDSKNIRNTSFTTSKKSEHVNVLILLCDFIFKYIKPLTSMAVRIRFALMKKNTLPPIWWRLTKAKHFEKRFKKELQETGQLFLEENLKKVTNYDN